MNTLRDDVRAAISNAYYDARNAGRTMEHAADVATDAVMQLVMPPTASDLPDEGPRKVSIAEFDVEGRFYGYTPRECGSHRTVGRHRAWCFDCSEWCYSNGVDRACKGCEIPELRAQAG